MVVFVVRAVIVVMIVTATVIVSNVLRGRMRVAMTVPVGLHGHGCGIRPARPLVDLPRRSTHS